MLRSRSFLIAGALGLLACHPSTPPKAPAPSATALPQGGPAEGVRVEGVVHVTGAPALAPIPTSESVARTCGPSIPNRALEVGPQGGLGDAVVSIDAPPARSAAQPPSTLTLDQKQCDYVPHVLAARAGATLQMVNSDPLVHSLHGAEDGRVLFNFAQPITGMRNSKALPTPGVVEIRCELHPWMQAFVKVFDAQHAFTVTGADGRFVLEGVPPGHHTLTVWQPKLGEKRVEVDVAPGMAPVAVDWSAGS